MKQRISKNQLVVNFSSKELLEIFPEAGEIIERNLGEHIAVKNQLIKEIKERLGSTKHLPEMDHFFCKELIVVTLGNELVKIEKQIRRLQTLQHIAKGRADVYQINEDLIHRARDIPITDVAIRFVQLKPIGNKFVAKCPFHNDATPSCFLYPTTNSYYCFGCGAGGDVINFIQRLEECSFPEAIHNLLN